VVLELAAVLVLGFDFLDTIIMMTGWCLRVVIGVQTSDIYTNDFRTEL